jgi:cobalamin-dependent methionine synthase I
MPHLLRHTQCVRGVSSKAVRSLSILMQRMRHEKCRRKFVKSVAHQQFRIKEQHQGSGKSSGDRFVVGHKKDTKNITFKPKLGVKIVSSWGNKTFQRTSIKKLEPYKNPGRGRLRAR